MPKAFLIAFIASLAISASATHVRAVAATETAKYDSTNTTTPYTYTYTYNSNAPTNSDITNWTTGWGASGVTGWNYVGYDGGASAVYLGNGYVLTAEHVGAGNLMLGTQTYDFISGSSEQIGSSDLILYRIDTTSTTGNVLTLPTLTLPATTSSDPSGQVVMIGYGNGVGEAWAKNTVSNTNQTVSLSSSGPTSTDFYTMDSFHSVPGNSDPNVTMTSDGQLVAGDSGGGAFIYNSSTNSWVLAGINEVYLEDKTDKIDGSGMVQLDKYAATINLAVAPEPSTWLLLMVSAAMLGVVHAVRRQVSSRKTVFLTS